MRRFTDPRYALKIRLPTLIIAAGADPVCATPATERFASRLKAGHALVIPGARHEIMMERDAIREQFWAAFDAFIPGTPDRALEAALGTETVSAAPVTPLPAEQFDGSGVEAAVARRDDAAAISR
jgi:lysophospholipase